jgi:hypothetical protein
MLVQNTILFHQLEKISQHYRQNVANPYIKPEFYRLHLDKNVWNLIEELTERNQTYRQQGYHLDELYRMLWAVALFIKVARSQLVDQITAIIKSAYRTKKNSDQLIAQMSAENFAGNLGLLGQMVYEAFTTLTQIDEQNAKGIKPIYKRMEECQLIMELGK